MRMQRESISTTVRDRGFCPNTARVRPPGPGPTSIMLKLPKFSSFCRFRLSLTIFSVMFESSKKFCPKALSAISP